MARIARHGIVRFLAGWPDVLNLGQDAHGVGYATKMELFLKLGLGLLGSLDLLGMPLANDPSQIVNPVQLERSEEMKDAIEVFTQA